MSSCDPRRNHAHLEVDDFETVNRAQSMTTSKVPDDLEIAPGYTVECWKSLTLDPGKPDSKDWTRALEIFEARIRSRFFEPVDELVKFDNCIPNKTFGFAILAIDCLVIEALQGFREGVTDHTRKSEKLFTNFLTQWGTFKHCVPHDGEVEKFAEQVYDGYRCVLHHSGATKGAFRVWAVGPMFVFKNDREITVNRTCLHNNLKLEFDAYVADLRTADNCELRRNFRTKMNAICGL